MFDVGFFEVLVIGVIALLVIGPERLPAVAAKAGKWVGRMRKFVGQVKSDIDQEIKLDRIKRAIKEDASLHEIKELVNDTKDELSEAKQAYLVQEQPGGDGSPGQEPEDAPQPTENATLENVDQEQELREQEKEFDMFDDEDGFVNPSHRSVDQDEEK